MLDVLVRAEGSEQKKKWKKETTQAKMDAWSVR
jgi:hypothetical protein